MSWRRSDPYSSFPFHCYSHPDYLAEFRYFLDKARQAGVQVYVSEIDVYQGPGVTPDGGAIYGGDSGLLRVVKFVKNK